MFFKIALAAMSIALACSSASALAQEGGGAPGYSSYVIVPPAEVRYINNEMRFCEKSGLQGSICKVKTNFFGKERSQLIDWWRPASYVQAVTGLRNLQVLTVEPFGPYGEMMIRFIPQVGTAED